MESKSRRAHSFAHLIAGLILCLLKVAANDVEQQRRQRFLGVVHPEQVHISFGDTPRDIVIMWATKRDEVFYVEFAETVESMKRIEGEIAELDDSSGRTTARYLHRVELKGLKQGVKYVYRIAGKSGANSDIYTFTIPQEPRKKKVHTFMIIADMSITAKSLQFLVYEAVNGLYEAVFHVGDIAYDLDLDGDKYLRLVEKFAAQVPYMTVPGDHELTHDYAHYRYRFSMPNSPWPMPAEKLWYSLDIGPAHIVAINTEVFYSQLDQKDELVVWLQNDLLSLRERRDQHPWLIVLGHKPMYSSRSDFTEHADCSSEEACIIRAELEDMFYQEGVDLYISGHRHNYERTWPIYRGRMFQEHYDNPSAPIYIINGAMGYQVIADKIVEKNPWSAFSISDTESKEELYGKLEILNGSHLMWDVFYASNNKKVDSILITRKVHGSFGKAGDNAYEEMKKFRALPPAPAGWHPPVVKPVEEGMVDKFHRLQPSTRKFYLLSACLSLLTAVICLISSRRVRRQLCKK